MEVGPIDLIELEEAAALDVLGVEAQEQMSWREWLTGETNQQFRSCQ